ncbi:hypothetical protein TRFO_39529 [Tritrichomonas foetus]|uniref:ubiquitinyl hydrolase 1 n=1 Tax=Tritrichomonas foetus TaxID=1144522 RepID=A0A1J4J7S3_9EUKA|nr:hypothetical protein TRFO_39529 [Tritrichomonas foetus]|eukprot:OHS94279.1 hypothetical protein TRFO_39529 [Tritrichomonas foetus]
MSSQLFHFFKICHESFSTQLNVLKISNFLMTNIKRFKLPVETRTAIGSFQTDVLNFDGIHFSIAFRYISRANLFCIKICAVKQTPICATANVTIHSKDSANDIAYSKNMTFLEYAPGDTLYIPIIDFKRFVIRNSFILISIEIISNGKPNTKEMMRNPIPQADSNEIKSKLNHEKSKHIENDKSKETSKLTINSDQKNNENIAENKFKNNKFDNNNIKGQNKINNKFHDHHIVDNKSIENDGKPIIKPIEPKKDTKINLKDPELNESETYQDENKIYLKNNKNPNSMKPKHKIKPRYNGLYNQGATCYINSALQSLFHLPHFRNIVYHIPTENVQDPTRSIPLNLQCLFYKLQFGYSNCSTRQLTESFGWKKYDSYVQQDIQEFLRILISNLEDKMKNTELKNEIAKVFEGKAIQTISKYISGTVISEVEVVFYDLSINIRNSLEESLKAYTRSEVLNNYTDDKGKQKIVNFCTKLLVLPKVLQIHLKRYNYNLIAQKNDNSMSYKEIIDLKPFMSPKADKRQTTTFRLFEVLVHCGKVNSGHYYMFCKPDPQDQWYMFNDSLVEQVSQRKVFDENFGGYSRGYSHYSNYMKDYSAYMLIYVREDCIDEIFTPILEKDIPAHIVNFASKMKELIPKDIDEKLNKLRFTIITEDCIRANCKLGIPGIDNRDFEFEIFVDQQDLVDDLYNLIASNMNVKPKHIRLWTVDSSYKIISILENDIELESISPHLLFVEMKNDPEADIDNESHTEKGSSNKNMMYFMIKLYTENITSPFIYIGIKSFKPISRYSEVAQYIANTFGCPEKNVLTFEENTTSCIKKETYSYLPLNKSVETIIVQFKGIPPIDENLILEFASMKIPINAKGKKTEKTTDNIETIEKISYNDFMINKLPNLPSDFYEMKNNTILVDLFDLANLKEKISKIEFPGSIKLADLSKFIALACDLQINEKLNSLLIFEQDKDTLSPKDRPLNKYSPIGNSSKVLYYSIVSKEIISNKHAFTMMVQFSDNGFRLTRSLAIYLTTETTIGEIGLMIDNDFDKKYRAYYISFDGEMGDVLDFSDTVSKYFKSRLRTYDNNQRAYLRIEKIPHGQETTGSSSQRRKERKLMKVYHATVDNMSFLEVFGNPFYLDVIPNETGSQLKSRIQNAINCDDSEISSIKLYFPDYFYSVKRVKYDPKKKTLRDKPYYSTIEPEVLFLVHCGCEQISTTNSLSFKY